MPAITLRNICKRFGDTEVCRDISLEVGEAEFLTLLGSSGCGKTTTLNMIAGLDEPSSGDILIAGRRVNGLSPVERGIAMVFQNYALYPHMTVANNIGFALRLQGVPRAEIRRKVEPVAQALELGHVIDRYPAQLSGGQQQRVAIGRAIIRAPKVFLFDEPFSNLDAALRIKMRGEVKELHERLGVTSVFVTHDQEEAMSISDRIAVMRAGAVEQVGTPEEIYARPATTYVARFIGSPQVEILSASRASVDGAGGLRIGSSVLVVGPGPAQVLAVHTGDIDLAIRPEHVHIAETGIPATVRFALPLGPATIVTLDLDGGSLHARLPGLQRYPAGTAVRIQLDADHLMLFDRASGRPLETASGELPGRDLPP